KKFENDVKLFNYDMVDFKNPGSYDCIVILLDSINYVLENEKIEKLFNNCYKNLKENGVLIFDLNSPYKMEKVFGDKTYVMENKNIFYTWENYKENNLVEIYLNFFIEKDGLYQRFEEYQTERIYKPEEMLDLALNAGFNHVSYTDEDNPGNLNDKSLRLLYYATKEK
ncbi:MAG: class I SAM-dependent methyltransferase, partial [Peptoniphilaceae bacterium]|nr:class I SAM-dependent methyltransferase [Peptoniphilaceae bacterium]